MEGDVIVVGNALIYVNVIFLRLNCINQKKAYTI